MNRQIIIGVCVALLIFSGVGLYLVSRPKLPVAEPVATSPVAVAPPAAAPAPEPAPVEAVEGARERGPTQGLGHDTNVGHGRQSYAFGSHLW